MWVTRLTEVFKLNVDFEINRQDLAFVLSYVFRREFHLACPNVVTVLDESSVEHDSEHHLVAEPFVDENNFSIAAHGKAFLLLIGQLENDPVFVFLSVFLGRRKSKYFGDLHALAVVNNKAWSAARPRNLWHLVELYSCEPLHCRGFYLLFVIPLKVVQVAKLARLTDTFATDEALVPVETKAIID